MKKMKRGYDHAPRNLIPEAQIVQHRLDFPLDFSKNDDDLRHDIMYTKHRDDKLYTNSIDLNTVLTQCKAHKIVPIIALNFFWKLRYDESTRDQWVFKIPPDQYARCARLTAELIIGKGLKGYVSTMNEPKKWLTTILTGHYCKAAYDALTPAQLNEVEVIVGCDEYMPELFKHLGELFKGLPHVLFGFHALSSMGTWENPRAYFYRIKIMADLARYYGLRIVINEGGSWFLKYPEEGHAINRELVLEAEKYEYDAFCVVLPDINISTHTGAKGYKNNRLGYRVWDDKYETILEEGNFDNFIKLLKEGIPVPEYDAPEDLKTIAENMGNPIGNYDEELPVLTGTGMWQNAGKIHKRNDPLTKGDFDATMEKILRTLGVDISVYYNADGSWNPKWREIARSNPKEE